MIEITQEQKEMLAKTLVSYELLKAPSNVLIDIGNVLIPLKLRPTYEYMSIEGYIRIPPITNSYDENLNNLAGKFIIINKRHFNMRGKQLLEELGQNLPRVNRMNATQQAQRDRRKQLH